jgi:ribosomal peptide maturation radical SAM protein 1
VRGVAGYDFWEAAKHLLSALERDLARWCIAELEIGGQALELLFKPRNSREPLRIDLDSLEGRADPETYRRIWGDWFGREQEFYRECARLVTRLAWQGVLSVCGPQVRVRALLLKQAHQRLASSGLLKAIADSHGFPTTTLHLNLDFAAQIGSEAYLHLCRSQVVLADEWLFSPAALGDEAPDMAGDFLTKKEKDLKPFLEEGGITLEGFRALRDEAVPRYLDRLLETIPWREFRVVGFSSTFAQTLSSFALARRLKSEYPEIITLFGGANFDDEMGLEWARAMDCIDYVVIGEGDQAFPEFLGAVRDGGDPAEVPGVVCRRDGAVTPLRPRPLFEALDTSPVPDYAEFFTRSSELGLASKSELRRARIPYESARGCWWGAKHHCTFCGLNKNGMAFRSKSPERVLEELAILSRRHRSFEFFAVDNILDLKLVTGNKRDLGS